MLLLCLVAMDASALRRVDPGEQPRLDPDEGLLVISVDSDDAVSSMRFDKVGSLWTGGTLRAIEEGRTTRMYVVPAGRYRWTTITLLNTWSWRSTIDLSDDDEYTFEVKPAQITYAGDLVYRSTGFMSASLRLSNRALPIIDWLQREHPALYGRLPFAYSGYYPDPFPAFYRDAVLALDAPPADSDASLAVPSPVALPLPPRVLWKPGRVSDVALSHDGQLVAEAVRETAGQWALDLIDPAAGTRQRLSTSDIPLVDVRWESDRILLTTAQSRAGDALQVFHIGDVVSGVRSVRHVPGPVGGVVVDLLPGQPGEVLYQNSNSRGRTIVHRLQLDSPETISQFDRTRMSQRLNQGVDQDLLWFADGHGALRAAFARRGEDLVLMHGEGGEFREVLRYEVDAGFQPVQLSRDGDVFYGLTDEGRAQRDFVAVDLATGRVGRTLYSKPGVDLVSVLFDRQRNPIGATYYQAGRLVSDYFDQENQHLGTLLREAFPGRTVAVVQRSRDASRMLLWVDGSDLPPRLYLLDVTARQVQLLDEARPELSQYRLSRGEVLKVHGSDGLPVEAFLTVPPGDRKRPLVVMPHGGPIGVSDTLHFNPEVQFLASLGYAVLQVNFRGSDGYGSAFREAGHRNHGKLIEDDIDAAVAAALAGYPIDERRMCTLGASYGGYSAMLSTIRWPDRFRCAVSIAGVSDRVLFFTASDSGRHAAARREMELVIGNPTVAAELADMQATSPLYRYRELKAPVMLVHGGEDARVDYEHTRRLVRMLNMAGRPPVLMEFPDAGHGLDDLDDIEAAWTGIAGFLHQHLSPTAAVAIDSIGRRPTATPAP